MRHAEIPLDNLFVSELNTRKDLEAGQEDSGISQLAESIRKQGLLNPLIVRPAPGGRFEVLVGQRRLLACLQIAYDPVPCLVRDDIDDADAVALSLIENVHRADMHPLDKARALKALYDRYDSYERVAKETAWSATTVSKYVHLLPLPEEVQHRITTREGPARVSALAKLAATFHGNEALQVYEKISAWKQDIQMAILEKSGGDISRIDGLVMQAAEGAFDIRQCAGAFRCEVIRDVIEGKLTQSGFQDLVREVAENLGSELSRASLRKAARDFWKILARG